MTKTIDVHNHLFCKDWIDYLGTRKVDPKMEKDASGKMIFTSHGAVCSRIAISGHYDPETRIADMERCGIDVQVISHTLPSVEELPVEEGIKWARNINDYFAEVCRAYTGRFYAFATLPLQDVNEGLNELERAYKNLDVRGICMYSNVNFKPISSPEFYPIYERAEKYNLPIFIHPAVPFTGDVMRAHGLVPPLYGFTLDTTMAVMSLVWNGILEKYPGLKIIHAHLGGVVPYLVQRMEDCWTSAHSEIGLNLKKSPSNYYRNQVYPDTMSAHLPAMKCCLDYVGPGHMCLGTDYSHRIGNWEKAIELVRSLKLPKEDTDKILGSNAAEIFHIE